MKDEIRRLPLRLRVADDDDASEGVLIGYAATYGERYQIGPAIFEEIEAGAFDESIAAQECVVPVFYAHDWSPMKSSVPQPPIGVASVGGDERLGVEAVLFLEDFERARAVYRAAEKGALREWSIGYRPTEVKVREEDDGTVTEIIEKGELLEVSVVVRGAARNEGGALSGVTQVRDEDIGEDEQAVNEEIDTLLTAHADREWVREYVRLHYGA